MPGCWQRLTQIIHRLNLLEAATTRSRRPLRLKISVAPLHPSNTDSLQWSQPWMKWPNASLILNSACDTSSLCKSSTSVTFKGPLNCTLLPWFLPWNLLWKTAQRSGGECRKNKTKNLRRTTMTCLVSRPSGLIAKLLICVDITERTLTNEFWWHKICQFEGMSKISCEKIANNAEPKVRLLWIWHLRNTKTQFDNKKRAITKRKNCGNTKSVNSKELALASSLRIPRSWMEWICTIVENCLNKMHKNRRWCQKSGELLKGPRPKASLGQEIENGRRIFQL